MENGQRNRSGGDYRGGGVLRRHFPGWSAAGALTLLGILFFFSSLAFAEASGEGKKAGFLDSIRVPENIPPPSGAAPLVIAIVDDGVRTSHEEIRPFLWENPAEKPGNGMDDDGNGHVDDFHGWDVSDGDPEVDPPPGREAEFYHGTHLAGIAAKIAWRAYGPRAPEFLRIMPVKTLSDQADRTYLRDGYRGIRYAVEAGADIILCAWGMAGLSPEDRAILELADKKGALLVASAGNFATGQPQFPAGWETALAVAALDDRDQKAADSNFGGFVDLSARGVSIPGAGSSSDTAQISKSGTSPAAAMLAVAAALVKQAHPEFGWPEVIACLKGAAAPIDGRNPRHAGKLGAGKLDVAGAIACATLNEKPQATARRIRPQGHLRLQAGEKSSTIWGIAPPGRYNGIRFRPVNRRGNPGESRLRFFAGETAEGEAHAEFSVKEIPEEVFIPGGEAAVRLEMAGAGPEMDWLVAYHAEPIDLSRLHCRDTVRINAEVVLEDGSGPEPYSANSDCKWLITAPEGKVIRFDFLEFDTEARTDLLYFFNGAGTHEKIMAIFSGPDIPPQLTTWNREVLVWFVTSESDEGDGWKAEISFVDRPESVSTGTAFPRKHQP
jgi:hypothetical protein